MNSYTLTLNVIVTVLQPGWDKVIAVRVQPAFFCTCRHFPNTQCPHTCTAKTFFCTQSNHSEAKDASATTKIKHCIFRHNAVFLYSCANTKCWQHFSFVYLFSPFAFEGGGCRTVWLSSISTTHFVFSSISVEERSLLGK